MTQVKDNVNANANANTEESMVEKPIDPWQKLQAGFKGIRLLKNPTRLKEIRDLAHELKPDFNKQVVALDNQQKQLSDPLDKLSAQRSITELKKKISTIDTNLAGIVSRVEELVKESKSKSNS